jgi:hypothetical protein
MSNPEDWFAQYQRQEAARIAYSQELAKYVIEALRFLGVYRVAVDFDGCGDDGEIHAPEYAPAPACGLPEGLDDLIREASGGQLPGGWEINSGSSGSVILDVKAGTCDVEIEWHEEDEDEFGEDDWE